MISADVPPNSTGIGTVKLGAGLQTKPLINDITYSLDDNLILS
jgi:hypothetical protein